MKSPFARHPIPLAVSGAGLALSVGIGHWRVVVVGAAGSVADVRGVVQQDVPGQPPEEALLLLGESKRFSVLAPEPPRIRLRRRQGATEDRSEECVLLIHRCARASPLPFQCLARRRSLPHPLPLASCGPCLRLGRPRPARHW